MLTVTPAARARLLSKLDGRRAADDEAMRFTRKKNGWQLQLDQARPDDTAFIHDGRTVLLLDTTVAKAMAALTLDVRNTDVGDRLKLRGIRRGSK